jgi:uncharacterized protein involved in cysteine biosynthesis
VTPPAPLPVSAPLPRGVPGMLSGTAAFLWGLKAVLPGGGLFRYALAPALISLLVLGVLVAGAFLGVSALLGGWLEAREWPVWLAWLGGAFAAVLALLLAYFTFTPVMILFGPLFMDPICERVHLQYAGAPLLGPRSAQNLLKRQAFAVVQALKWTLVSLFIEMPLAVLALFTVVGSAAAVPVRAAVRGLDLLDYPLALRHFTLTRKLQWARENPMATLGLGGAASLAMFVPLVNLFVVPAGAAAATVLMIAAERRRGTPPADSLPPFPP